MKFTNPYRDLPSEQKTRTTIDVADSDLAALQSIRPGTGMQTTIAILLVKLVAALKEHGYNEFNPDGYEDAIGNARIILPLCEQRSTTTIAAPRKRKVRASEAAG